MVRGSWDRLTSDRGQTAASWAWLVLLMAYFGLVKWYYTSAMAGVAVDGGFYTDVALHVRDGHGLRTNLSAFNHGYDHFPHITPVYPLWPLVYGYSARLVDWQWAAKWLPATFWWLSLLAAYFVGRAFDRRPLLPRLLPGLGLGHLMLLILGLHKQYMVYTSKPYTEGLSMLLQGLAILLVWQALRSLRVGWMAAAGLACGLALVTRTQNVLLLVAAAPVLLGLAVMQREAWKLWLGRALAFFGIAALPWMIHYAWVLQDFPGAAPLDLMRWDTMSTDPELTPIRMLVQTDSPLEWVTDRLQGAPLAFVWKGKFSYTRSFSLFPYLLLLAAPLFLYRLSLETRDTSAALASGSTRRAAGLFLVLYALLALASIHAIHKSMFTEWNFHRRQAVVVYLPIALAGWYCLRHGGKITRFASGAIIAGALWHALPAFHARIGAWDRSVDYLQQERAVLAWARAQPEADDGLRLAFLGYAPRNFAFMTRDIGYHWLIPQVSYRDLERYFTHLDVDFLVRRVGREAAVLETEEFERRFVPVGDKGRYVAYRFVGSAPDPSRENESIPTLRQEP
jgi:hypothetical protein